MCVIATKDGEADKAMADAKTDFQDMQFGAPGGLAKPTNSLDEARSIII